MREKNTKWKYYVISGVSILVFLLVWYLISDVFHVFRHNMLPGPGKIVQSFFVKLTSKVPDGNTLLGHIKASLIVVVIGYLIGVAAGLPTCLLYTSGQGDLACMGSPSAGLKLMEEGYVLVGGLRQQGNPQQDSILVSEDFYKDNYDTCVNFMASWLEAAAKLNSDQEYEETMVTKFYTEHGRSDFSEKDVKDECGWNTYMDASNIKDKETGAWMQGLIQCYVEAGAMEENVLDALKQNTTADVVEDALKKLEK